MNASFWKLSLVVCGLLFYGDSIVAARKKRAKVVVAQTNSSNTSSSAAAAPARVVVQLPVAPPRPPRPARPLLGGQSQQVKAAGSVQPLPSLPIAAPVRAQEQGWVVDERRREALKAEVNEARSDAASLKAKIESYIRNNGKNASAARLEEMKRVLSKQQGNEIGTYENFCLAVCRGPQTADKSLAHTACYLLAWQYASQLKTRDGSIDVRAIILRLYASFEMDNSFVREYSQGRCETLATYIFSLVIEALPEQDIAAISVSDKYNVLAPFLYRRKDESQLRDSIIAKLGAGIPEITTEQAEGGLRLIGPQVHRADIEILKTSLTEDEKRALAFARKKAFLAQIEIACSDRELKELEAFENQYCVKNKGRIEMDEIELMQKQILQRKVQAGAWFADSTEKAAGMVNSLEPASRSKYQPSIFAPVAKFFHNRYLHYTGFAILGALAGVYGYWMYRKIVPAKLPRFI